VSSSAYSFYELPESRHSSDSQSQQGLLGRSQYDGTAPSRPVSGSGGAYHSIRLNRNPPLRGTFSQPPSLRIPSQPFVARANLNHHGVSPLPARPYSRTPSTQQTPRLSTGLITQNDLVGGNQEAMRAVQRDLSSPLDLLQDRAASYFGRIGAGTQTGPSQTNPATLRTFQHQVTYVHPPQTRQQMHGRQPIAPPQALPEQPPWTSTQQTQRRGAPTVRAGQRSSENMPVGTTSQGGQADPPTQSQRQRMHLGPRPNPPSSGASM
jgi:hypothetical protein